MVVEVVVAATNRLFPALLVVFAFSANAKVLPEDRADVLWHSYDGGGITIVGPSVLIRKSYADKISVWGNYYVDMISGASIDVEATASRYSEERKEASLGLDYLYDKTLMGIGITQSKEDDYTANTFRLSISQDFFGDLSTLSLGYARGDNRVRRNGDASFEDTATSQSFRIELSQVLTPRLIMNVGFESVADSGFLNNPYRSVRFLDSTSAQGYSYQAELYPRTRASDAASIRAMYYLPYRAALRAEYRFYSDSWGIAGQNLSLSYTHPFGERLEFDLAARYYDQGAADFYSDLYPYRDAQNFLARDKELASFDNTSIGFGVGYTFSKDGFWIFSRGSINAHVDYKMFDYEDFLDVRTVTAPGAEPQYSFDAVVARVYLSLWF